MRAVVMSHTHAKNHTEKSVGSTDRRRIKKLKPFPVNCKSYRFKTAKIKKLITNCKTIAITFMPVSVKRKCKS